MNQGPGFVIDFLNKHNFLSKRFDRAKPSELAIDKSFFEDENQDNLWLKVGKEKLPRKAYNSPKQHYEDILKRVSYENEIWEENLYLEYLYDYILRTLKIFPNIKEESFPFENRVKSIFKEINESETIDFKFLNEKFKKEINSSKLGDEEKSTLKEIIKFHLITKRLKFLDDLIEKNIEKLSYSITQFKEKPPPIIKTIKQNVKLAVRGEISPIKAEHLILNHVTWYFQENENGNMLTQIFSEFDKQTQLITKYKNKYHGDYSSPQKKNPDK